ncbi:helix-turn-helix transcriptional regulator, partial [Gemmatimonadota bacterium]
MEKATDDVLRVEEGSLYPALHRMQQRRWIRAKWGR